MVSNLIYLVSMYLTAVKIMSLYPTDKNVGGWDRLLRLIVGSVLLIASAAAVVGVIGLSPVLIGLSAMIGAILTATGLTQKCPLNNLLRMDTYKGRKEPDSTTEPEGAERPS